MSHRIYNFSAGPAILPEPVLDEAAQGVREINGSGMSLLEVSHRGKDYEAIHSDAEQRLLRVLGLSGEDYYPLFLQGGASMQFAMVPMNFLDPGADRRLRRQRRLGREGAEGSQAVRRRAGGGDVQGRQVRRDPQRLHPDARRALRPHHHQQHHRGDRILRPARCRGDAAGRGLVLGLPRPAAATIPSSACCTPGRRRTPARRA